MNSEEADSYLRKYFLQDIYKAQQAIINVRIEECNMELDALEHNVHRIESEIRELKDKRIILNEELKRVETEDDVC